jgi:hypothetical protein
MKTKQNESRCTFHRIYFCFVLLNTVSLYFMKCYIFYCTAAFKLGCNLHCLAVLIVYALICLLCPFSIGFILCVLYTLF